MIARTVYLNPVEPAQLSVRSAMGVNLDLVLSFVAQNAAVIEPVDLIPQLAILPRSGYGIFAYDVEGDGSVSVPGSALIDPAGYTLELYQRRVADNPDDPPVPVGLLAKGVLRLEGSAYFAWGPLAPINVPVVIGPEGPMGPQGEQGIQGIQGEEGEPGPIGDTGPPGPANELTVGTVTTGAPGSPVIVTITGDAPAQVINFTIPSGLTGATGPIGPTGANVTLAASAPGSAVDGALWWNTATNTLYVREAGVWVPVEATWGA